MEINDASNDYGVFFFSFNDHDLVVPMRLIPKIIHYMVTLFALTIYEFIFITIYKHFSLLVFCISFLFFLFFFFAFDLKRKRKKNHFIEQKSIYFMFNLLFAL